MEGPKRQPLAMSSLGKGVVKGADEKTKAVDLVTGKATQEYFFDPSLLIQGNNESKTPSKAPRDSKDFLFFQSKQLFMPCTIIKPILDEENQQQPPPPQTQQQLANSKKKKKKKGKSPMNSSTAIQNTAPNQPFAGPTLVKTSDGVLHKISDSTKLIPLQAADYEGVNDVLHLPTVSEAALLHTLRLRYRRDDVYTAAGQILISINPYKAVVSGNESIYSESRMMLYRSKGWIEKPPHLFQIADRAYTALMDSVHTSTSANHMEDEDAVMLLEHHHAPGQIMNQSIIISGESGAGKTEATKIIMKYLAKITRKNGGSMIAALSDRVLSSNPLLETFGNAQTLRNNNSSRFGKFIHIYFGCVSGAITGASISNYLLEKTRITHQVEGERNYHIFYQLLSGADDEMLKEFGLEQGLAHFRYLGNKGEKSSADGKSFAETVACLTSIGLTDDEQRSVFGMAAAVLHLGNIQFEESDSETAKVSEASMSSLVKACELLGLDVGKMTEAVLTKVIFVNGKSIHKPQNVAMAEDKRDALAKLTYSSLFLWLVTCVNEKLEETSAAVATKASTDKVGFIGVLDIYGFECFETNGFEQLLINYCNEKLQRHFNRHLFEAEQELYANEGVDWSYITFNDNRPCLELIEGGSGSVGILHTLDDAWSGMGTISKKDGKFAKQLHDRFGGETGHPNFVTTKFGNDRDFTIVHYAGEVKYTVDGFVEKNMETLSNELRELGEKSTKPIAMKVYSSSNGSEGATTTSLRSSIRGVSVGSQFRTSLQSLVSDLERTQPHYIRCIKPNLNKSAGSFMAGEILKQLRYSGMMEAIRIRQEGYALREEHESFFDRFSVLLNPDDMKDGGDSGIVQLVKTLSKRLGVSDADWQVGHSKIFLRRDLSDKLERLAKLRVHCAARTLTKFGVKVAHKRTATFVVVWVRFRLRMLERRRLHKAAAKISALARGLKQRKQLAIALGAVVRIQTWTRLLLAVHRVRKIRDPFYDLTFRECKKLLIAEKESLDKAVKEEDFHRATELEAKIIAINDAIESKRPLTRTVIDEKIAAVKKDLEDAVKRKAFAECGPLQDRLEELTGKLAELPTLDELREAVATAEAAMSLAAKNRDFAGAAEAQSKIDKAKKRLIEALTANNEEGEAEQPVDNKENNLSGCESRAQLESDIGNISTQINAAIRAKDFVKASTLQKKLEEKEGMRKFFPSVDELQLEINEAKKEVENAVANKDFAKAGVLSDAVAELEQKLEGEKGKEPIVNSFAAPLVAAITKSVNGEKITFADRSELEKEISMSFALVSKCVAARDFKQADLVQADVDSMIKLRELLPSATELQQQLRSKTKEMDSAISNKQFAKADELQRAVEEIERKLKSALASVPQSMPANQAKVIGAARSSTEPRVKAKESDSISVKTLPVKTSTTAKMKTKAKGIGSDSMSMKSVPGKSSAAVKMSTFRPSGSSMSVPPAASTTKRSTDRPVAKLRPAIPLIGKTSDTILSVTKLLAGKRGNACVVVNENGALAGILTDTDITRRVVAKHLDPASSVISEVMTPNPTCVAMTDSAMDALTTMVENHFRHLPVVDGEGSVVGLLDIAKCLNDAISKLEKNQDKSSSSAEHVVKQVISQHGANGTQAVALQALLGNLMSQAFGGKSMPTLRSVLASKPSTVVSPDTTIRDAGLLMADNRKAALIVEDGEMVGIFTFKDMMTRAVAKEMPLEATKISEVMTPNPDAVSPDITVLEALQTMHDQRYLTLPVCENDGTVVGLVDVMDVIYGCGGADGWRSIFNSAMELQDDVSDASSVNSISAALPKSAGKDLAKKSRLGSLDESTSVRPVSMLRPSKPIMATTMDSILDVVKYLTSKRGSASLITSPDGSLAGILTSTDVTRRVVAKSLDTNTNVTEAMTPSPKCVTTNDSAMDALTMMVENHFRHLPVVDDSGSVVGLLDIAKCLNSVISKLEHVQSKSNSSAQQAVKQVISEQGAKGSQAEALQLILGQLMSQAFGNQTTPTLRSLLADMPRTVVSSETSVRDASLCMAERRKAALVVDGSDQLVGIFGFKDMLTRVVAKELPIETTAVSEVMTPNPVTVSPDITVLDALQTMHDNRFLTLPVCEDDGRVVGLVDVMDVIYGCGGAQGWRAIFTSMMDMTDDVSETASLQSKNTDHTGSRIRTNQDKSVAKLRPVAPYISGTDDSILSVVQFLTNKRGSASLIINTDGGLAGILTDTDITRRVVAKYVDPASTVVSKVMTPNPTCVAMSDSATDALTTMVENHFRHLPVVDGEGSVVGLLDIAKCLNDAISKLEKSQEMSSNAAEDAVKQAIIQQGANTSQARALQALLGNLMSQAFGSKTVPTLRSLLAGKPSTIVGPNTSIREAGILMAENRKAALIVEEGELVGIFGFKDLMTRAVATDLSLESTPISDVMTPNPEVVLPDITVLEALQTMHDQRFLTLPVCEENGTVVGLVDVMDVIYGCGGADGWRSIFNSAMDLDDSASGISKTKAAPAASRRSPVVKAPPSTPYVSDIPSTIPATLEFLDGDGQNSFTGSTIGDERGVSKVFSPEETSGIGSHSVVFKVSCPSGSTHRIRCEPTIDDLVDAIAAKITIPRNRIRIEYEDDEGDTVVITSDDDVAEAWNLARKAGKNLTKLSVVEGEAKSKSSAALIGGGLAAVALLGAVAFAMLRPKK